jgi:hypothetical protein
MKPSLTLTVALAAGVAGGLYVSQGPCASKATSTCATKAAVTKPYSCEDYKRDRQAAHEEVSAERPTGPDDAWLQRGAPE